MLLSNPWKLFMSCTVFPDHLQVIPEAICAFVSVLLVLGNLCGWAHYLSLLHRVYGVTLLDKKLM